MHKFLASDQKNKTVLISYMKGVGVLVCLLGSTWVLGLLLLVFNSLFLAYAFTLLNSLQGVGIFVFQCLLNPATRGAVRRVVTRLADCLAQGPGRTRLPSYQLTATRETPATPSQE